MMNTVILISGQGSNLQAIIDETIISETIDEEIIDEQTNDNETDNILTNSDKIIETEKRKKLPINIAAVISNNPDAYGLKRAKLAGLHTEILDHRKFKDRRVYDDALQELIEKFEPELIVLAGFMRILSCEFVNHYLGRLINIHPSLLPQFPGLDTHQQALDAAAKIHGASAHFVTPELDSGPVIIQASIAVKDDDTADSLKQRVLEQEHIIYPTTIRWFANKRLTLKENVAYLDGWPLVKT